MNATCSPAAVAEIAAPEGLDTVAASVELNCVTAALTFSASNTTAERNDPPDTATVFA